MQRFKINLCQSFLRVALASVLGTAPVFYHDIPVFYPYLAVGSVAANFLAYSLSAVAHFSRTCFT